MKLKACALGAVLAVSVAAPAALAHHSFAMFDQGKIVTAKGTVKEFEWVNPHSWLRVMIADPSGKQLQWAFEMSSPGTMAKLGMTPDIVKPGDNVTVTYHPLRDGSRGGQFMQALLPTGKMAVRREGGPNLLKEQE